LTQLDVYDNAEEKPGAYGLLNNDGKLLYLAWSTSLAQALMKHLSVHERNPALRGKAKSFTIYKCLTEKEFISLFDKIVEQLGELPLIAESIPRGSKYFGKDKPDTEHQIDVLIARARAEFKADNVDEAFNLMVSAQSKGEGVPDYHNFMGLLTAVKGFMQAIKHFEKAAEAEPTSSAGIQAAALAERCYDLLVGFKKL
jgi:SRSO17 transposase